MAGIGQDGARDGQQLALSLAEIAGALRKQGLVAVRQLADEMIGIRHFGCLDDILIRGIQPPVADVLHDRIGEQEGILQDQPELIGADRPYGYRGYLFHRC